MKKFFTSKTFIITSLSALCLGVLAFCLIAGMDKNEEFQPCFEQPSVTVDSWKESPSQSSPQPVGSAAGSQPEQNPANTETASQNPGETVVDFTPPDPVKPDPPQPNGNEHNPEAPVVSADITNPSVKPSYKPEELTPPESPNPTEKPKSDKPAPGSVNEKGEVYDPVFGWVKPSKGNTTIVDGEGDINKQVGEMGKP